MYSNTAVNEIIFTAHVCLSATSKTMQQPAPNINDKAADNKHKNK